MFSQSSYPLLYTCLALHISITYSYAHHSTIDGHRDRRNLAEDDLQNVNFDLKGAADSTGSENDVSAGADAPNSWLYKFPPWFFPNNPPPDGFSKLKDNDLVTDAGVPDILNLPDTEPADGDVILVSDKTKSDRSGRLYNIKIPGNSEFRDEVVQTLIDIAVSKAQNTFTGPNSQVISSGISIQDVTPLSLSNAAPSPPPPPLEPTISLDLQSFQDNLVKFNSDMVANSPPFEEPNLSLDSQFDSENDFHFQETPVLDSHFDNENNFHLQNTLITDTQFNHDNNFYSQETPQFNSGNQFHFQGNPIRASQFDFGNNFNSEETPLSYSQFDDGNYFNSQETPLSYSQFDSGNNIHSQESPVSEPTFQNQGGNYFRPSPPDLTHIKTRPKFDPYDGFRPSPLTPVSRETLPKPDFQSFSFQNRPTSFHQNVNVRNPERPFIRFQDTQPNRHIPGNRIPIQIQQRPHVLNKDPLVSQRIVDNTFKNLAEFQSTTPRAQQHGSITQTFHDNRQNPFDDRDSPLWLPFIPSHIPQSVQSSLRSQGQPSPTRSHTRHRFEAPHISGTNFRYHHQSNNIANSRPPPPAHLPTSIQDIINSGIDNSKDLLQGRQQHAHEGSVLTFCQRRLVVAEISVDL
ncbi:hypothetical protein SK128_000888 [Halocaridina rubra]|uniref:Uncharacterized protein n=1 Tax=Halocaridina rubra TaxID=373956 RepID=A0AAN8WLK2_HALRR